VRSGTACGSSCACPGPGAKATTNLWDAIRDAIDAITPGDCRAFLTAAGYEPE
jgi:hypothetical protein